MQIGASIRAAICGLRLTWTPSLSLLMPSLAELLKNGRRIKRDRERHLENKTGGAARLFLIQILASPRGFEPLSPAWKIDRIALFRHFSSI